MKRSAPVFIFCVAMVLGISEVALTSECPPCVEAQSNACRRWGSGQAKFQWASGEDISSSITLSVGSCGQPGEAGIGYIMLDCDTHSATCNNSSNSPCNDGLGHKESFAIIKIQGSKKAFHQIFPGGIGFTGDKVYTGSTGHRYYQGVSVTQAGCDYKIPLEGAGHSRIAVSAAVAGCDSEYDGGTFNIEVKFFQELESQSVHDRYTLLATTTGSIQVKQNKKRDFDPVNFIPDMRDGSSVANIKEIYHAYDSDSPWKIDYRGMDYMESGCDQLAGWCGPWGGGDSYLIEDDQTFYRVKYPGWEDSVKGQPLYAKNDGWGYDGTNNRLTYGMGSLGTVYYHCEDAPDGSVRVRTVERCTSGQQPGNGTIEWTLYYDSQNRLNYIHNASYTDPNNPPDPNTLTHATKAYEYVYSGDSNDPSVTYKTRPNTASSWTPEREWTLEFNDDDKVIKYIGGCNSGCSGSATFEHIEYHSVYKDEILWKKNAAGQMVLRNDYEVIEYGDWEDAGWFYIPDGNFEVQDVSAGNCDTFDDSQSSWDIDVVGTDDSTKICDPNSASGQYLQLDGQYPDTLWQDLYAVMSNTRYELDVDIRGHTGQTLSNATITLNAVRGVSLQELAVIDVNDFDLTDGEWITRSIEWDSTPHSDPLDTENYLIDYDNPWVIQIVVTGDKVDIDNVNLSTRIWVGGQTRVLLNKQERMNSAGNLVTVLERDYNQPAKEMIERSYIASDTCRITKYEYDDEALVNIIKKTDYENTGTSTAMPDGDAYVTTYGGDDPNEIYITYAPNGKRADYQRYEYGNLVESYVIDRVTDANSMRETFTYEDVEHSEYYGDPMDWRLKTHTNARGGVSAYVYQPGGSHLLTSQTDPENSAGQQITTYTYDDAHRVITETRKLDDSRILLTSYNYNSTTGFLDSMTVNGATTYYYYNAFGQVIRQTSPDGIITGKSYGTGGELVSEFVISENTSSPNGADTSLTLISQTRYTYTDDGQIELIGKYKSDTEFSYQSDMTTNASNWILTKYEYDANGQKKKTIEDYGTGRTNLTTEYFYNYQGELEKVLYPTGKWVKTSRDGRGLVILEETGYGSSTVLLESAYSYDDNGNLEQQSNPDGSVQIYTYDSYDRLKRIYRGSLSGPYTEKFYNNAGDVIREIACETDGTVLSDLRMDYDDLGNLKSERLCADPNSLSDADDLITHYVYDIAGNLRKEIRAGLTNTDPSENPDPNDIVTEYIYNNQGRKTQTIDPKGWRHSIYYTTAGLPEIIVDPNDPDDPNAFITENIFDPYGRIEKTIDPMGHYTENTYNSLNQVTKQVLYDCKDPNTPDDDVPVRQIRTEFDNLGNITCQAVMADPNETGNVVLGTDLVTEYVFDSSTGLLDQQKTYYGTTPTASITYFDYDDIGRRIQTTDPEGNVETIYYNTTDETKGSQVDKVTQLENDPDGANDYRITTFYEYDTDGRLYKTILDRDGYGTKETTDQTTQYEYDGLGRLEIETADDGIETYYEYDGFGNVKLKIDDYGTGTEENRTTEFVYNRLNQQDEVKAYDPNDTTAQVSIQTTTYQYDENGNVTKIIYPDNEFAEYQYGSQDKLITEIKRDGTWIGYWHDWNGNLTQISDYDADDPNCPNLDETFIEIFKYNGAGQLTYAYKEIEGVEVSKSTFAYNGFGARTSETARYNDNDISKTTTWTYDGSGNILSQSHGNTTLTYTHDGLGRIKTIEKGNDDIVAYDYIGRNTESIDYPEADATQLFGYDELGRTEQCKSIDGNSDTILDFQYTFDSVGNRDTCKYNHLTTPVYDVYEYDTLRRLEKATYADADGIVAMQIDRDDFSMDTLVLVASAWISGQEVIYLPQLEADKSALLSKRLEQMEQILKEAGFRNMNAFLNSVKSIQPVAFNPDEPIYTLVEFGEDIPNNYHSETCRDDDNNIIAQIIWDNKDRMVLFAMYPDSGGTVVVTTTYDNQGNVTSNIFMTIDEDGNVTETVDMLAQQELEAQAAALQIPASVSSVEELEAFTQSSMMTLMSSTPESPVSATEEFLYDHLGNRYQETQKNGFVYTYSHNPVNQYLKRETEILGFSIEDGYDYDDNGNLYMDTEGSTYLYDYRNRLVEVQSYDSNSIAEYTFDALGRRISKTVESETTYFFYDPQGRVIAEYDDSTTPVLQREYVYGNGIDEVLAMFLPTDGDPGDWDDFLDFCSAWLSDPNDTGTWIESFDHNSDDIINFEDYAYFAGIWEIPSFEESDWYYLRDALGSTRGLVGGRFQRESDREFYNYDVYGRLSIQNPEESKSGNPYLFAGYRYDAETGLYYVNFRTYDPETGRWIQFDPIGNADSMSLYEYCVSNPANYVDPFGLSSCGKGNLDSFQQKIKRLDCPECNPADFTPEPSEGSKKDWGLIRAGMHYMKGKVFRMLGLGGPRVYFESDNPEGLKNRGMYRNFGSTVEFSHESKFAKRASNYDVGTDSTQKRGGVNTAIRKDIQPLLVEKANGLLKSLQANKCTSFQLRGSNPPTGYRFQDGKNWWDKKSWEFTLSNGYPVGNGYNEINYSANCCLKKGCDTGKLLCRIRFNIRDLWTFEKDSIFHDWGDDYYQIVHFDMELNETIKAN
jgi:RHS repeat-associated protein